MKTLATAIAAIALIGTPAFAADMAVKIPVKAPPPPSAPVYNWTGCFIGANIGYGWQRTTTTDVTSTTPPFDLGTDTGTGVVGGGQLGCDYQFAPNWVVGIQGMFDGAGVKGSHLVPFSYSGDFSETETTKTDWFTALTARIGYSVVPQALLYFKGGPAWVHSNYSDEDLSGTFFPPYIGQASGTRSGWTIGGGGEYLFAPNWSVFVEYNYVDLGTKTFGLTYNCGASCGFSNPYFYSEKQNFQAILIGLNYRFGVPWGSPPPTITR
jgi:outer membrane immunogenic protein